MRKELLPVITFAKIDIRRLFRDKLALFFTFVFPLMFLVVFGGIFGHDSGSVSFHVALLNQSDSTFAKQFVQEAKNDKLLKIDSSVTTMSEANEKMSRGELDAAILLPPNFGDIGDKAYPTGEAQVIYDKNSQQAGSALTAVLSSVFDGINAGFVKTEKPFSVTAKETSQPGLTQFDYVFSGLLGFTLLGAGIFGPINVFPRLKEKGVLRRYHTTTLKVWQYFLGNVLSNVAAGLMAVAVMFAVGLVAYDLDMRGSYLLLGLLVVMSAMMLFGIGLAAGGWARNERQAAPLGQIIALPMMFLSGAFFPRFLMPEWLQGITSYIPLSPVVDAARLIITENKGLLDLLPQFGLIAAWVVIVYAIAFKVFRWE